MNDPTLKQLRYAVAVADHLHFGDAADAEFVSQPGLSSQIRELERRLDAVLFERNRNGVRLTAAGAEVVAGARQILSEVANLRHATAALRGAVSGDLRVAAIPTMAPYVLPQAVELFASMWPEARLELAERQTEDVLRELRDFTLDLGLIALPYDTGSLVVEAFHEEAFHLALPTGHPLAKGESPLDIGVMNGLNVLLLEDGHCLRDHALQACALGGEVTKRDVRDGSLTTLIQMVAVNAGVTLLPETSLPVEARHQARITTRPFIPPTPGRTLALAWRPGDPRHQMFSDAAQRMTEAMTQPSS